MKIIPEQNSQLIVRSTRETLPTDVTRRQCLSAAVAAAITSCTAGRSRDPRTSRMRRLDAATTHVDRRGCLSISQPNRTNIEDHGSQILAFSFDCLVVWTGRFSGCAGEAWNHYYLHYSKYYTTPWRIVPWPLYAMSLCLLHFS